MFKRKSTSEDQENGNVSCSSSSSSSSWSSAVLNLPKKLKTDNNNNRVVLGDNQAVQMEEDVSTEPVPTVKPKVTTSQTFKSILQRTLSSGKYSVSGEADELPMYPNIHVNNFGPISLPLNESQAIELLNVRFYIVSNRRIYLKRKIFLNSLLTKQVYLNFEKLIEI